MNVLEDQLTELLNASVDHLHRPTLSPTDLDHRGPDVYRGVYLVAAMALLIVVLAAGWIAVSAVGGTQRHEAPASQTSTTADHRAGTALPGDNAIAWPYRGTLVLESPDDIDARAADAWTSKHHVNPASLVQVPLWSADVHGESLVLVSETPLAGPESGIAFTVLYAESPTRQGTFLIDAVGDPTASQVSATFSTANHSYTAVVAAPGTTITYAADGRTFAGIRNATQAGDGWAVFPAGTHPSMARIITAGCATCTGTPSAIGQS